MTRIREAELELEDSEVSPPAHELRRSVEVAVNAADHRHAEFGFSMATTKGIVIEITRILDDRQAYLKNVLIAASQMCDRLEQEGKHFETYFHLMAQQTLENPQDHPATTWDTRIMPPRFEWKSLFKKKPSDLETLYASFCGLVNTCQELYDRATKWLDNPLMSITSIFDEHIEWMPHRKTAQQLLSEHLARIPRHSDPNESLILVCRELQEKAIAARAAIDHFIAAIYVEPEH